MEDWRLSRGQEDYLSGVVFHKEDVLQRTNALRLKWTEAFCPSLK